MTIHIYLYPEFVSHSKKKKKKHNIMFNTNLFDAYYNMTNICQMYSYDIINVPNMNLRYTYIYIYFSRFSSQIYVTGLVFS